MANTPELNKNAQNANQANRADQTLNPKARDEQQPRSQQQQQDWSKDNDFETSPKAEDCGPKGDMKDCGPGKAPNATPGATPGSAPNAAPNATPNAAPNAQKTSR